MTGHEELLREAKKLAGWQQHRFIFMIGSSIGLALFLVIIAMSIYNRSGAAQLDLSRPGYQSIRRAATAKESEADLFPATGPLTQEVLKEFRQRYQKRLAEIEGVEVFGGDVMSDATLRLDMPPGDNGGNATE